MPAAETVAKTEPNAKRTLGLSIVQSMPPPGTYSARLTWRISSASSTSHSIFYWDASVFDGQGVWIKISHDEHVSINAKDASRLNDFEDRLAPLNLGRIARRA
jgi:hypothetical protein